MNGLEIAVLVAVVVVIVLAVSVGRRRRGESGDEYPWWTLGMFAVGSRAEEEAREARDDVRLAGEEDATHAPDPGADGIGDGAADVATDSKDVDAGPEVD